MLPSSRAPEATDFSRVGAGSAHTADWRPIRPGLSGPGKHRIWTKPRRNLSGMSDTKTPGDKTLHVSPSKTLTLKRPVEQGTVRQSFSHGRSKAVVVEKVKRRAVGSGE